MATFTIKRGDSWDQGFEWRQVEETGDPVNLTGATARLHLRDRYDALMLDCTPYLTVSGVEGVVTVRVPGDQTALLPVGKLSFDLEMTYSDGTVQSTETQFLKIIADETV